MWRSFKGGVLVAELDYVALLKWKTNADWLNG